MSMVVQVAIKKVLQDKHFKNRELQIMKMMDHCNILSTRCVVLIRMSMMLQVAIKKVLQDKRFKNRELQITQCMDA